MQNFLDSIVHKTSVRLIPFMLMLYILSFLDRSNIGFAKDAYSLDVGLSDEAFAFGAGVFFIAYAFLGVPANMMMRKLGAKKWIGFTTVVWGGALCKPWMGRYRSPIYCYTDFIGGS